MSNDAAMPVGVELVRERYDPQVPGLVHDGWSARMPWLVQGTTTRGSGDEAFDLGLFADASAEVDVRRHWRRLLANTEMPCAVHARQVHEADVRLHRGGVPGLSLVEACDGHVTATPGVLLAVTTADCVPVFVVAPDARVVGVLHAGWRGAAAGVLESGLSVFVKDVGFAVSDLHVHLGPAICGACYEVGPEVFRALGQPVPAASKPIDLRRILAARAAAAGVPGSQISVSTHCTRCTGSGLFSHRGGDGERQVGYVGIRP